MTPKPRLTLHGTPCSDLVISAIKTLNERKGSSNGAIMKFIIDKYNINDSSTVHVSVNHAIREALESGVLIRKSGSHGATGKFRLANPKSKSADEGAAVQNKTAKSPKKATTSVKSPKRTSAGGSVKKVTGAVKKSAAVKDSTKKSPSAVAAATTKDTAAKKPAAKAAGATKKAVGGGDATMKKKTATKAATALTPKKKNAAGRKKKVVAKKTVVEAV